MLMVLPQIKPNFKHIIPKCYEGNKLDKDKVSITVKNVARNKESSVV